MHSDNSLVSPTPLNVFPVSCPSALGGAIEASRWSATRKSSIFSLEGTAGKDKAGHETQGEVSRGSQRQKGNGGRSRRWGHGTTVRPQTKEGIPDTFYL